MLGKWGNITREAFIITYLFGNISLNLGMIQRQTAEGCLFPGKTAQVGEDNHLLKVIMYKKNKSSQ